MCLFLVILTSRGLVTAKAIRRVDLDETRGSLLS